MNTRKIQIAKVPDIYDVGANITVGKTFIYVDRSVIDIANGRNFQFARRPFAGATRVKFVAGEGGADFGEFWAPPVAENGWYIYLCRDKSIKYLGIGERTRQFSVWFKPI
jgi:hypothetical protein